MKIRKVTTLAIAVTLASSTALAQTGRQLHTTSPAVANGDGTFSQEIVDQFWDARCAGNVAVTLNPILLPNETLAAPTISVEETAAAIDAGLQRWTDNPSSFIDMSLENVTALPSLFTGRPILGDFVNEANFELDLALIGAGGGTLAVSLSTTLLVDTTFEAGPLEVSDLDGDGDSDVFDPAVEGANVCFDVDGDGDVEFPAGDYAAGTILDNDVLFNAATVWETTPTAAGGADIDAVSTHEYGHSHGLTHSTINQFSAGDGTTATMFPAISTFDPASELSTRVPSSDDLAASAFVYPEGSDYEGAAALQAGDVAFDSAFSVIEGSVETADGTPVVGAAVSAINRSGETVAVTFSGEIPSITVDGGGAALAADIANGDFRLAVPAHELYTLKIEALDGGPVTPGAINTETGLAAAFSVTTFPEETLDLRESSSETDKIIDKRITALPARFSRRGFGSRLTFILNDEDVTANTPDASVFASVPLILGAVESFQFVEAFDADTVLPILDAGDLIVGVNVDSGQSTAAGAGIPSETAVFSSLELVLGTVDEETGIATLGAPISDTINDFVGQEGDAAPANVTIPILAALKLRKAMKADPNARLFVVVSLDEIPSVAESGAAVLPFVLPIVSAAANETSFLSVDGSDVTTNNAFFGVNVNWDISLRSATPARRSSIRTY